LFAEPSGHGQTLQEADRVEIVHLSGAVEATEGATGTDGGVHSRLLDELVAGQNYFTESKVTNKMSTAATAITDRFEIANLAFTSRLIIGTGKYRSYAEMNAAIELPGLRW